MDERRLKIEFFAAMAENGILGKSWVRPDPE